MHTRRHVSAGLWRTVCERQLQAIQYRPFVSYTPAATSSSPLPGALVDKLMHQYRDGTREVKWMHRRRPSRREYAHSSSPWLASLGSTGYYPSKWQRLHEEIVVFKAYAMPTSQERLIHSSVIAAISKVVSETFRDKMEDPQVLLYGSTATDLCLPRGSDVNLALNFSDLKGRSELRLLSTLQRRLVRHGITESVSTHFWADVSAHKIHFTTIDDYGAINVTIAINYEGGREAVVPMNAYLDEIPSLRPLFLVLKALLSRHGLDNSSTGGLNSYALFILVTSFLQLNPTGLPSDFISDPQKSESLGTLLHAFLIYYGDAFPYKTSYISLTDHAILPKGSPRHWTPLRHPQRLAVQCLVDPNSNAAASATRIHAIRRAFRVAATALEYPHSADGPHDILGTIVGISSHTLKWRQNIRKLVYLGGLPDELLPVREVRPPVKQEVLHDPRAYVSRPRRRRPPKLAEQLDEENMDYIASEAWHDEVMQDFLSHIPRHRLQGA